MCGMWSRGHCDRQIGMALQESVLFSGTIRHNIRYGRPDATDEEVEAAARAAMAHDFIVQFPDRYETLLGQRGVNLSGGTAAADSDSTSVDLPSQGVDFRR